MILAAGLGTRLRPLTDERPKPLVPVANRPLAWFTLDHLARFGIREVIVNTHHLGDMVRAGLEAWIPTRVELQVIHEAQLLGTGGALHNAASLLRRDEPDAPVIVMNSDIVFAADLERALELHSRLGAVATMVLRRDADAARYGSIAVDAEGRIRRLLGEPRSAPASASASAPAEAVDLEECMFTGVHVLSPRAFRDMPERGCVVRSAYRRWIDTGETVGGIVDETPWRDVGSLATYLAANLAAARGDLGWPGLDSAVDGVLRAPTAVIEPGAVLDQVVLGERAIVRAGVRAERVVVWDGATLDEDASGAIVTSRGIIPIAP